MKSTLSRLVTLSSWYSWQSDGLRSRRSRVRYFQNRNQFSITMSGQEWWRPILCTVKWVKIASHDDKVFDLAIEQPQMFRKLYQNGKKSGEQLHACLTLFGWLDGVRVTLSTRGITERCKTAVTIQPHALFGSGGERRDPQYNKVSW